MNKISQYSQWWQKPENKAFYQSLPKEDPATLLLKYQHSPEKRFVIEQYAQRLKVAKKLPNWVKNEALLFPKRLNLEQASSEATARFKAQFFNGYSFTDLTGGFGVDCYYMAKNFELSNYNEPSEELRNLVTYNYKQLSFNASIYGFTADELLKNLPQQDLIYLDPSRRNASQQKVVDLREYEPNLIELASKLLACATKVLVKVSPMINLNHLKEQLPQLNKIWVISLKNECKEVLLELSSQPSALSYSTYNITEPTLLNAQKYEGTPSAVAHGYALPNAYILEPNASILKAGLANTLSRDWTFNKLHPNTNLLTTATYPTNFPGKVFKVETHYKPFTKQLIKERLNVVVRNFPAKGPQIEQKLKLKPAKKDYLLAYTGLDKKYFSKVTLVS